METRDPIDPRLPKLLRRVVTSAFVLCAVFYAAGPPVLAYLYPWEPPVSDDGVDGSALRVIVPEGEPYEISFGSSGEAEDRIEGTVPDGEYYVDHPVPQEARSSGFNGYEINVLTGVFVVNSPDGSPGDVPVQAILFVDGEYALCNASQSMAIMNWSRSYDGLMDEFGITVCNFARWDRYLPFYPDLSGE